MSARKKYHEAAGFVNLNRVECQDHVTVYCARCGRAQTILQVRLNKINDGQYSLCCDDNLVSKRPINCLEPKRFEGKR